MVDVVGMVDLECSNFVDPIVFVGLVYINVQSRNNKFFSFEKHIHLISFPKLVNLINLSLVPTYQSKST